MAASAEAEEKAIHERLKSMWGTRTAIKYGQMEFTEPTGDTRQYIAIFIQSQQAQQIDIGVPDALSRFPGFVVVQVFGNQRYGTRPLKRLADVLTVIYQRMTLTLPDSGGVIRFGIATVSEQPNNLGWAQVNVDIPFRRDSRVAT